MNWRCWLLDHYWSTWESRWGLRRGTLGPVTHIEVERECLRCGCSESILALVRPPKGEEQS